MNKSIEEEKQEQGSRHQEVCLDWRRRQEMGANTAV